MRSILFLLLFTLFLNASAKITGSLVWINFSECNSCLSAINVLTKRVLKELPCKIIFKSKDLNSFSTYNDMFFNGELRPENCEFSDSLYKSFQRPTSTFFVIDNDTPYLEIPLKVLPYKLDIVYSFFKDTAILKFRKVYNLPDSIALSSSLSSVSFGNYFIIRDLVFKKFLIFNAQNELFSSFVIGDERQEKIFYLLHGPDADYQKYLQTIKKYKEHIPVNFEVKSVNFQSDTLFIGVGVGNYISDDSQLTFKFDNAILKVVDNKIISLSKIPEHIDSTFFINLENPFYFYKNSLIVSTEQDAGDSVLLHSVKLEVDMHGPGSYTVGADTLKSQLPDYFVRNKIYYELTTKNQNENYEWFVSYPTVINKHSGNEVTLQIPVAENNISGLLKNLDKNFFLFDVVYENGLFKCLYLNNGYQHIGWFDGSGSKINSLIINSSQNIRYFPILRFLPNGNIITFAEKERVEIYSIDF